MSDALVRYLVAIATEPAQVAALALALLVAWPLAKLFRRPHMPRWLWGLLPLCAAALSRAYLWHYLRGGPRIIDATAYLLQARGLADGGFSLPLSYPEHATLGRFLLRSGGSVEPRFSVIFPPGYPALLALGVLAGAPLWVGPALAIAVTAATMGVARQLVRASAPSARVKQTVATRHTLLKRVSGVAPSWPLVALSGCLAVVSGALRYHTADTMSHGAAALWWTLAVMLLLSLANTDDNSMRRGGYALGLGGCWGMLFATRPVSALALGMTLVAAAWWLSSLRARLSLPLLWWLLLGCAPGVGLWLLHQHEASGQWWGSAQQAYYAVSDGPPGCFRYGFGVDVGCRGEHGQFVLANLPHGFGWWQALATSARRLWLHAGDALNTGPLLVTVLLGAYRARRCAYHRVLVMAVCAQVLVYVPFYFDGNYPGGGARMFADILPIELVLAASGWLRLLRCRYRSRRAHSWGAALLVSGALLGFALHRGSHHAKLRDREGGWPMYQPRLTAALPAGALLLVDTDHGFNLARALSPRLHVVRRHSSLRPNRLRPSRSRTEPQLSGELLAQWAWQRAGRPAAYRYDYWVFGERAGTTEIAAVMFDPSGSVLAAADLWPPLQQHGGYAWPRYRAAACLRSRRVLMVTPHRGEVRVRLRWPRDAAPPRELSLWAEPVGPAERRVRIAFLPRRGGSARAPITATLRAGRCRRVVLPPAPRAGGVRALDFSGAEEFAIDALTLRENMRHNQ